MDNENSTILSPVGQFAQAMGVKVITLSKLSFQDQINLSYITPGPVRDQYSMGPFIRLDISKIVENYGLMKDPNICPRFVLYTDADVIVSTRSPIMIL